MIDTKDYINNLFSSAELYYKISEKAFKKTEIDIVYSEIINWERAGLIDYDNQEKKGDWKKITYREYTWLKIINYLKDYGFSTQQILILKDRLFGTIEFEQSFTIAEKLFENYRGTSYESDLDEMIKYRKENDDLIKVDVLIIDTLIIKSIIENEMLSILVSKELDLEFLPLSFRILKDIDFLELSDIYNEMFNSSYVNIPISKIVSNYLIKDNQQEVPYFKSILSEEEYKLLKLIRKNKKDLKSMTIAYKDGKADRVEVTEVKQVELESKLMHLIKKGEYLNINIVTQNGNIIKYENTKKIKI